MNDMAESGIHFIGNGSSPLCFAIRRVGELLLKHGVDDQNVVLSDSPAVIEAKGHNGIIATFIVIPYYFFMQQEPATEQRKKRTFRTFTYRGVALDQLLDMNNEQLMELFACRQRRRFKRGLKRKHMALLKKLRRAKKECPALEKPAVVKTHLRDMIILPEMVGSMIGVYNGKTFIQVEIKPDMIGHYLAEFAITYKAVKHGRPGIGATHSSRFIPLK